MSDSVPIHVLVDALRALRGAHDDGASWLVDRADACIRELEQLATIASPDDWQVRAARARARSVIDLLWAHRPSRVG